MTERTNPVASDWIRPGEASAITGLHPKTLGRYADGGLIKARRPRKGGHRSYARKDIEDLANGEGAFAVTAQQEPVAAP